MTPLGRWTLLWAACLCLARAHPVRRAPVEIIFDDARRFFL